MLLAKYTNIYHIMLFVFNFLIGIKYSLVCDLFYLSYTFDNKYLYVGTMLSLSYAIQGFFTTIFSIFLVILSYQAYYEKINKEKINEVALSIYQKILKYKLVANIEKKIKEFHEDKRFILINTKLNECVNYASKVVCDLISKKIENSIANVEIEKVESNQIENVVSNKADNLVDDKIKLDNAIEKLSENNLLDCLKNMDSDFLPEINFSDEEKYLIEKLLKDPNNLFSQE